MPDPSASLFNVSNDGLAFPFSKRLISTCAIPASSFVYAASCLGLADIRLCDPCKSRQLLLCHLLFLLRIQHSPNN